MVGRDLVPGPLHRGDLLRPARPVQNPQKDFVDEPVVVSLAGDELGQFAPRIGEHVADGRAAHQRHHRPEGHAAGPLAFAGAFARRLAEGLEEARPEGRRHVRQRRRPRPLRIARKPGRRADDGMEGVVEGLRREAAGEGMRVVDLVVVVPAVVVHRQPVRPRGADLGEDVPHVEAAVDERPGQVLEEGRVRRRIAGPDVVDRIDDPGAEQIAPQPVDVALGEVGILGGGHPGGELLAPAHPFRLGMGAIKGKLRRHRLPGPLVRHLATPPVDDDLVERLGPLDGRPANAPIATLGVAVEPDLGEERGRLVVLILRPAFERMVVALVAVEAHAQEKVGRVLHRRQRVAERLVIGRGRVLPV